MNFDVFGSVMKHYLERIRKCVKTAWNVFLYLLNLQIPPSCRSINPILSTLMKKEPDIFGEEVMQGYAGNCGLPFELGCSIYDGHFFIFTAFLVIFR